MKCVPPSMIPAARAGPVYPAEQGEFAHAPPPTGRPPPAHRDCCRRARRWRAVCARIRPATLFRSFLFRTSLANDRPLPRRPGQRRQRGAGQAQYLLLRVGRWWRLEDEQCGAHVGAGIRLPADRFDRCDWRRAFEPGRRVRRHGRVGHAVADLPRQRGLQNDRRRRNLETSRARRHPADRSRPGRSSAPGDRLRGRAGPRLRSQPGSRRVSIARRRRHVAEGPVQGRQRRRDRPGPRSSRLPDRLRDALEHATAAMEHLSALVRAGWRHLQVDRRGHVLEAARDGSPD